ncbi:MAG: hypothetical protein ACOH1X_06790 [Kaistella sp.]
MKKFLLLSLVLMSVQIFACKCANFGAVGMQYQNADFVGEIEITKIYGNDKKSRTYKADIAVLKTYKGNPVKTLEISGLIDEVQSAACEVELSVGEKFLIYLSKNDLDNVISMTTSTKNLGAEKFTVSSCTPRTFISEMQDKKLETERQVLVFLSKRKEKLAQAFFLDKSVDENSKGIFKNYEITDAKNNFAVYKLKVNGKSEVDAIEALQNFESSQDEEIMELIRENAVIAKGFLTEVRYEEVLLTLFYVPKNNDSEFASTLISTLE